MADVLLRPIPSTGEAIPAIGLGTWQAFDIGGSAAERGGRRIETATLRERRSSSTLPAGRRASRHMISVLRESPLSYPGLSKRRGCRSASAVHEPSPPRHSQKSSTARVRLHLKPGQKGTKQFLAQYGDRLICVRYRYDAQQRKRFKTVELLVAESDWEPVQSRFAPTRSLRYGSPLPTWPSVTG